MAFNLFLNFPEYKAASKKIEGIVISVKDGVAKVSGLEGVMSGEMVVVGKNAKQAKPNGMVLSLNKDFVSIVLFNSEITSPKCGFLV